MQRRLADAGRFRFIFQQGSRIRSGPFFATVAPREAGGSAQPARLGMTIGKKAAPRAVDRNRLKRIIRESFRLNELLSRQGGVDIVIGARQDARRMTSQDLRQSLDKLWTEAGRKANEQETGTHG